MADLDAQVAEIPAVDGRLDLDALAGMVDKDTAAILVQSPNFFGIIEDLPGIGKMLEGHKGLFVVCTDPISLGILEAPARLGADIVVGEGQSLGLAQSFGGPLLGFMGVTEKLTRRIPGRVVGETRDTQGRRGFVLTLQTREQHIRREKATSNICSNQALCALAASVYLSLMGPGGLREVARQSLLKAAYAREQLAQIPGVEVPHAGPWFKVFALKLPRPAAAVIDAMVDRGYYAGIDLGRFYPGMEDCLLVAVTEKRTREEIDGFRAASGGVKVMGQQSFDFERSVPGRTVFFECDVPEVPVQLLPAEPSPGGAPAAPGQRGRRHPPLRKPLFLNHSVDTGFYPLGSA